MARELCKQLLARGLQYGVFKSPFKSIDSTARCISTSALLLKDKDTQKEPDSDSEKESKHVTESEKQGWFKNLLRVRTLEPSKESHSSRLSSKETVYEIQSLGIISSKTMGVPREVHDVHIRGWSLLVHAVKPEYMEEYLKQFELFQQLIHDKKTGAKLIGSFTVDIGDQDEAIHIWAYPGGYPVLNDATYTYRTDKDFIDFRIARNKMLRSRKNQILLAFSFWPEPKPRPPSNIYEMRSYTLKPGTMIEWANHWARGIKSRTDEPVSGLFTQMGDLYTVHHVWGYKDLQTRKETREAAWSVPGWDTCVSYTVPLIRHMQSRILIPTPFSPLQ